MFVKVETIKYKNNIFYDNIDEIMEDIANDILDFEIIKSIDGKSPREALADYLSDLVKNSFSYAFRNKSFMFLLLDAIKVLGVTNPDLPEYNFTYYFVGNTLAEISTLTNESRRAFLMISSLLPYIRVDKIENFQYNIYVR